MSDLGDFFKMLADSKQNDPKAKQIKEVKENLKGDLGGLFSQLSELKHSDPVYQKNKQLEDRVKQSVKSDLGSLFSELASLKNKKQEIIEDNPELVEQISEEILIETVPLDTPIGTVPVVQQIDPENNPAIDLSNIDKYLKSSPVTAEEQPVSIEQQELNDINKKIKFIEQWIGKIQNTGPGSGEVNFRYLDDVDRSSIVDGNYLTYNATSKKFEFREVTTGSSYVLPVASGVTLGGVKIDGTTIVISDGVISATSSGSSFNPNEVKAIYAEVKNADSVTIHKGDPVYLYRATGNKASVILAANTDDSTSAKTLGLAYADFAPGATGIVITQGVLTGVDTSMYAEGDTLYLGSTAGTLTNVKPYSPNHLVYIGVVERANQGQGQIYVRPQNGYELEELHNVNIDHIVALADGHVLTWSATDNQWINAPLPATFSGAYEDLTGKPTLFSGAYADLTGKPSLFSGSYTDLTSKPTLFSGAYADLTGKPTLFSGSYTDLTDKPSIPSLTGYATESYVTTAITNLIGAAPTALDTLKEIADQLAADESVVSSLTTTVADKVSLTGSYANPSWITSLAGSKVTNAVLTTDTGTVTNTMLAGNIANAKLLNSSATIGTSLVTLGATVANLEGLNLVSSTSFSGALLGNASTATKLQTARNINGVSFDGSAAITIKASTTNALTIGTGLSGTSFDGGTAVTIANTGVLSVNGSTGAITGVVTTADTGTVTNTMLAGSIANSKLSNSSMNINGTNISLGGAANIKASTTNALTIGSGLTGTSFDGGTAVTIAVDSTVALKSNITYIGTTSIALNRASANLALTGILSIDGNAATATKLAATKNINGVAFDGSADITVTAAAGTLTGTTLNSTVTASNLQSVGQLGNLQISGGATVVNNSSTTSYANWGTIGQIFDDGNFHIHAKSGNMWINALDSSPIYIGLQYNSGNGSSVVCNTPYRARTTWHSAIDTEITLDNYRYRVTNSGGVFPQIISNIAGTTVNTSWVAVATQSGTSITQTGNTGALIPNNAWTSLFTNHGMDSSSDMVVATVTDKAHGVVHRVTFIREDNGSTTGYSILAEKLW